MGSLLWLLSSCSAAPLADIYNSMAADGPVEYTLLCIWEAGCQPRLPLSVRNKIPGIVRITQTWAAMAEPPPAGFRLPGSNGYHWTTQVVPSGIKLVCWGPGHTCGVFNCHDIVEFTFSQLSPWSLLTQLAALLSSWSQLSPLKVHKKRALERNFHWNWCCKTMGGSIRECLPGNS